MFWLHIKDGTFDIPDAATGVLEFPGIRRIGYATIEEATEQVVHDLSTGALSEENFVGIYDNEASEVYRDKHPDSRAVAAKVTPSKIKNRVATRRKQLMHAQVIAAQEQVDIVNSILPEGLTYADLLEAARTARDEAHAVAKEIAG